MKHVKKLSKRNVGFAKPILILAIVALIGVNLSHLTFAASGSLAFVTPAGQNYTVGDSIVVTVQENSGADAAQQVEAVIKYPANLLEYQGNTAVAPFTAPLGDAVTAGAVDITRGQNNTTSTGVQTVSVFTFKVLAAGSATLSFGSGSGIFTAFPESANVLTNNLTTTYTLKNPPASPAVISAFSADPASIVKGSTTTLSWSATNAVSGGCSVSTGASALKTGDGIGSYTTPALTATTSYTLSCKNSDGAVVTRATTVTVTDPKTIPVDDNPGTGTTGNDVSPQTTAANSDNVKIGGVSTPNGGTVNVTNTGSVAVGPTAEQSEGVDKVEYILDGKIIATKTEAPFTYSVDTKGLKDGTHDLVSKTYYSNGSVKQTTQHLVVKNASSKKKVPNSISYLLILIIVIAAGFVVIQRRRSHGVVAHGYAPVSKDMIVTGDNSSWQKDINKAAAPTHVPVKPIEIKTPPIGPKLGTNVPVPGSVIEHKPETPEDKHE